MPGKRAKAHNHALAVRAYKLRACGLTYREIADSIEKKPEQIAGLIALGERVLSARDPAPSQDTTP